MTAPDRHTARLLVMMLRQQSHDPDAHGEDAIPAWRAEAAAHGDVQLCSDIDAHDPALLIHLWDQGDGELTADE